MALVELSQNKEQTTGALSSDTAFYVAEGEVEINTTLDNESWMPFYTDQKFIVNSGVTARLRNVQTDKAVVIFMDF